jgi:transcriptional regulator with XRE-family HTH domain
MATKAPPLPVFSRRMKAARERLGISQMELGVRAGIDEFSASARINQYERGKHIPDYLTAKHLGQVLGVPPAYFYAEDEHLAEMIVMFGQLKAAHRTELLELAATLSSKAKPGKSR